MSLLFSLSVNAEGRELITHHGQPEFCGEITGPCLFDFRFEWSEVKIDMNSAEWDQLKREMHFFVFEEHRKSRKPKKLSLKR